MSAPVEQSSFVSGEISPSLLGRQDLARYHNACTTMRNCWPSYKGPAVSRAGTQFCGFSKQTGRNYPPRTITFQFSVKQGLALEFGHHYMRVLYDGAFVTEGAVAIEGVSNADPAFISVQTISATAATPVNTSVAASYAVGDTITLAGGSFVTPTKLTVSSLALASATLNTIGSGYAPADTITLAGGTGTEPVVTVATTQVVSATVAAGGTGGTNGAAVVTGTTGTGTMFQANVTIAGNAITAVNSIVVAGSYTVNPTTIANEPVTGAGLTGAALSVQMGVLTFMITSAGALTALPASNLFSQGSTSGSGTGAKIQGALIGVGGVSISDPGQYSAAPSNPVTQGATSGTGYGVKFTMAYATSGAGPAFNNGDWLYVTGVGGLTSLNGQTVVVGGTNASGFSAYDVYGNAIDTTSQPAYASGGTVSRIYTIATQYDEEDLPWLKVQESADVMSLCCVNQDTGTEYIPLDLARIADTDWVFQSAVAVPTIAPPTGLAGKASATGSVDYQYEVTAVSSIDGTESAASNLATITSAVDISATAGTITLTWTGVTGAEAYYVYKTEPAYSSTPPIGATFGFAGQALGLQFVDSNIVPDYTQTPPVYNNPFARGRVVQALATSAGTGYTAATGTVSSVTGSGAVLTGVVVSGGVESWIVNDAGSGYAAGDALVVAGDGTGAAASLTIGPESGTYPSVVSYFQERRAYANSLNAPDTYWMSQPGAFKNFDVRNPTIASDAVTGSPWAVQVNGIQWMLQTSGGLLVMTGLSAWLLASTGSFATNVQPISPSNQNDVPQAFSGCSALISPIKINYDVIYVNWNDQFYYDLPYQLYALSEPIDLTEISSHLFTGYTVVSHAWCEMPDKMLWAVRSDGTMLSLTYYKTQQVQGWARHDTQGIFVSNCAVKEPPTDTLYVATQRFINTPEQCYMIERMAARHWPTVEDVWAVDCALSLDQPTPAAMLSMSSPVGSGEITGYSGLVGGAGYSPATTVAVIDTNGGTGGGALATLSISNGEINDIAIISVGANYRFPRFVVTDPAGSMGGSGFAAAPTLSNAATANASAAVFAIGDIGKVLRAGGGRAVVTGYVSPQQITVDITNPFPSAPNVKGQAQVFASGDWTLTAPVTKIGGLQHLAGQTVTGLADGNVVPSTVVDANGSVTLATAASAVVLGLSYSVQMQSVPIDLGQPTVQGQRKMISAITARLESSLGVEAVANQTDGSILSPPELEVDWTALTPLPDTGPGAPGYSVKPYNAVALPLQTGDRRTPIGQGLARQGQIALEQNNPLPMTVLALIPEVLPGDAPQMEWPKKQARK